MVTATVTVTVTVTVTIHTKQGRRLGLRRHNTVVRGSVALEARVISVDKRVARSLESGLLVGVTQLVPCHQVVRPQVNRPLELLDRAV